MLKETIITVQTCDLKVKIDCHGCAKKVKKIMQKIDGVGQTIVDRQQGKVTVTGLMDMDTVFKKLKKAGMSAQLWDANSDVVGKDQKPQLGGSDIGSLLKNVGGKGLPQGEGSNNGGCGSRSSGGTNDATIVLPQLTPAPEQQLPNIQQQIEQRLRMLNGEQLLPQRKGMPQGNDATMVLPQVTPTPEQHLPNIQQQIEQRLQMLNREQLPHQPKGMPQGGMQSGKKTCGGTKVPVPGNANNEPKNYVGRKMYQDDGGSQIKNGAIGQPPHNGALGSLNNNHGHAKKDISVGVGSQMMGGSMAPQMGGMMRPTNNMIGPTSFPIRGQMGSSMGPYHPYLDGYKMSMGPGSSLPGNGFYPSSGGGDSEMEIMQQVARNPMPQQPYMMVQPQQEHEMMKNAHFPHGQNTHYGAGCTGYQPMGYDNGHRHLQQQYPPQMYYPIPQPPKFDNIFNDENPNSCSVM